MGKHHGGFPGGMNMGGMNMNDLMRQAQKMQQQMQEQKAELEQTEFTANAGGGAVTVTVNGKHEVVKVELSKEVVDPDDIEMLQDLIIAATNAAMKQVDEKSNAQMSQLSGGLGGMF